MDTLQGHLDVDAARTAELQVQGVLNRDHAEHLKEAPRTSRTIATAMGIIMANRKVDESGASSILCKEVARRAYAAV